MPTKHKYAIILMEWTDKIMGSEIKHIQDRYAITISIQERMEDDNGDPMDIVNEINQEYAQLEKTHKENRAAIDKEYNSLIHSLRDS